MPRFWGLARVIARNGTPATGGSESIFPGVKKADFSSREELPAAGRGAISDCASDRSRTRYASVVRPSTMDIVSLTATFVFLFGTNADDRLIIPY
jgi:hypothetical protein